MNLRNPIGPPWNLRFMNKNKGSYFSFCLIVLVIQFLLDVIRYVWIVKD